MEVGLPGFVKNRKPYFRSPYSTFNMDKGYWYVLHLLTIPQSMPVVEHKNPAPKCKAIPVGEYRESSFD